MALEPIGDIANPTLTDNTVAETPTWETASDWDAAVDELGVVHEAAQTGWQLPGADVIKLGWPSYDYQGSGTLLAYWPGDEASGAGTLNDVANTDSGTEDVSANSNGNNLTTGVAGVLGFNSWRGSGSSVEYATFSPSAGYMPSGSDVHTVVHLTKTSDANAGFVLNWGDGNGSETNAYEVKSGDFFVIYFGNDHQDGTASDGSWRMHVYTYDGSDVRLYNNGSLNTTGSAGTLQVADNDYAFCRWIGYGGGKEWDGDFSHTMVFDRVLSDSEVSNLYAPLDSATECYLTTATKSYSLAQTPDLSNLSYTTNNETIILDVIGSPGTASEETVSQTLDGSTSYSLTWSNSHTDFRIKIRMNTSSVTTSPEFGAVTLVG